MRILDPGHIYMLDNLDDSSSQQIYFVKREGRGYPGNIGQFAGTNLQEVLRALIDRVQYLDEQIPCPGNKRVVYNLRQAFIELEIRAAERHGRLFRLDDTEIEKQPACCICGHVQCQKLGDHAHGTHV